MSFWQVYSSMQKEVSDHLKAEQARLSEAGNEKAELAQENGGLKKSLQQEQEAAAESKV